MRYAVLPFLVTVALALGGCLGPSDSGPGLEDLGSSIGGSIGRNTDTYGTQRRLDVYGGTTAPVLPTISAPGYGK